MQKRLFLRVAALAVALLPAAAARAVHVQGATPATAAPGGAVSLTPAQAGKFQDALKALAAKAGVTFVAEGVPLRPTLRANDAPDLSAAAPLDTAVDRLAAAYDYDATRRGSLFVLKKRYTDPRDLPGVTLAECQLAMQDVVRVLSPHMPRPPIRTNTEFVLNLAKSLTPEQFRAMQEGTLRVAALSPAQRAEARRMALTIYVETPLRDAKGALARLKQAPAAALRKKSEDGRSLLGYDYTYWNGQVLFLRVEGDGHVSHGAPLPGSETPPPALEEIAAAGGTTLRAVVAALNARGGGPPLTVDAALAAKPGA